MFGVAAPPLPVLEDAQPWVGFVFAGNLHRVPAHSSLLWLQGSVRIVRRVVRGQLEQRLTAPDSPFSAI